MAENSGRFKKGIVPWNKGMKTPIEIRQKLSDAHKGLKHSEATCLKMSISRRGKSISRISWNFKNWRRQVFERDNFTCKDCGINDVTKLHPHHIVPFEKNIELRFEVSNGITLCKSCHGKRDGFQKGHIPWSAGKKFSLEHRKKLSEARKEYFKRKLNG